MTEKWNGTDEQLEAYLKELEQIEPPKAMAGEIMDRLKEKQRREIVFFDSRVFQVLVSLSACFLLLFSGFFEGIVYKTVQYNGQINSYIGQQRQENLQERFERKADRYQQKVDKELKRYEKK